jgi:hypothetical protein
MTSVRTISFIDKASGDEALVEVRVENDIVGLWISLRLDGHIEVFVRRPQVESLIHALEIARGMLPDEAKSH